MADAYVSATGSNTAPYDTPAKAATTINTVLADAVLAGAGPHIVYVIDAARTLTTAISDTGLSAGKDVTIRSVLGTWESSAINVNGASRQFHLFTKANTYTIKGFDVSNAFTFTGVGGGMGGRSGSAVLNVEYQDCRFDVPRCTTADTSPWLLRHDSTTATLKLTRCICNDPRATNTLAQAHPAMVYCQGNLVLDDVTCVAPLGVITQDQQANNQPNLPLFRGKKNISVGKIRMTNMLKKCPDGSTALNWAMIHNDNVVDAANYTYVVNDYQFIGCRLEGGEISGVCLHSESPYTVTKGVAYSNYGADPTTNGLGCVFVAAYDTGQGTLDTLHAYNNTGMHGTCAYFSQGGGGVVRRLHAHDNTAIGRAGIEQGYGGAVTCGGWGDVTVENCLIYNNTADEGGGISAHVHGSATRSKTTTIRGGTMYGNVALKANGGRGGDDIFIMGGVVGFSHTAVVQNVSAWSSPNPIYKLAGATATLTVDHCNVRGGQAATTNVDTYTNNMDKEPQMDANGKLKSTSPLIDAGTTVALTTDFSGNPRPFGSAFDIGANEWRGGLVQPVVQEQRCGDLVRPIL
jgi:hypothetical protein